MATGLNYQGRDGEIRFLDKSQGGAGASGTPFGIKILFSQMDFQMSFQKRPEELKRLDRQRITSDAHLQVGSEENLYDPVQCSFSYIMSSLETDAVLQFTGLDWSQKATAQTGDATNPWAVKGTPAAGLVSTKGRGLTGDGLYAGGRVDSKGSLIALQGFADKKKIAIDVEFMCQERDGSNKFGYRIKEVQFEPGSQNINESADFIMVKLTGNVYGEAQRITAFSRMLNVLTSVHTLT